MISTSNNKWPFVFSLWNNTRLVRMATWAEIILVKKALEISTEEVKLANLDSVTCTGNS